MTLEWPWAACLLGAPLVLALLCSLDLEAGRSRAVAIACAATACTVGCLASFVPDALLLPLSGGLRITSLSRPLLALPSALWLVTVVVTPAARLDGGGLRRTALATAFGTLAFLSTSPFILACCWTVSALLLVQAFPGEEHRRTRRMIGRYQLVSALSFVAGGMLMSVGGGARELGTWLLILAVVIRKGIFPFHAWIPEALDRGRIGPTVLFCAPQLGTYVAAILVVPHATPVMLRVVAVLSLLTALHGAALALFQSDARRALGYLFVSQSALVLAGLDCTSLDALTGALILWLSSALAFTGLARTVLALEARRGRLTLTRFHGGFAQMPQLATSFLVFGLACTGFPGTLGFIGQELLVDGAVRSFPALGFLTIGASALTGLAVLRMYFSLFCGSRQNISGLALRTREGFVFGAVAVLLVVAGVAPRSIVASREEASAAILAQRGPATPSGRRQPN